LRTSTEAHWSRFWRERSEIDEVYTTEGRVVKEILGEGPVAGSLVLEVGAGSGRDSVTLAEAGAAAIILDYSRTSLEVARGVAARANQRAPDGGQRSPPQCRPRSLRRAPARPCPSC